MTVKVLKITLIFRSLLIHHNENNRCLAHKDMTSIVYVTINNMADTVAELSKDKMYNGITRGVAGFKSYT